MQRWCDDLFCFYFLSHFHSCKMLHVLLSIWRRTTYLLLLIYVGLYITKLNTIHWDKYLTHQSAVVMFANSIIQLSIQEWTWTLLSYGTLQLCYIKFSYHREITFKLSRYRQYVSSSSWTDLLSSLYYVTRWRHCNVDRKFHNCKYNNGIFAVF